MADFVPSANSHAPESVGLYDIVQTFASSDNQEFPTRWINVANLLAPEIAYWGNIPTTPTIDNQKDLLSLVSLRV